MKKILLIPDLHFPFHDHAAYRLLLKSIAFVKPDALVFLGDVVDFYSVSSYSKDPKRIGLLQHELDHANKQLDKVSALGVEQVIFVEGNHEHRLAHYLRNKAPELFGLVSAQQLLKVAERGWSWVPYKHHVRIGDLFVTHDVGYYGEGALKKSATVYPTNSLVIGHIHRLSFEAKRSFNGKTHMYMCPGWLGSYKHIGYMHQAKTFSWCHGFGLVYLMKNGTVHVAPVPIVNKSCVVEGKLVK